MVPVHCRISPTCECYYVLVHRPALLLRTRRIVTISKVRSHEIHTDGIIERLTALRTRRVKVDLSECYAYVPGRIWIWFCAEGWRVQAARRLLGGLLRHSQTSIRWRE